MLSEFVERSAQGQITPEARFQIEFAPDYLHKANISGDAPYGIEVPNSAVDGLVLGEVHQTTFVNYLRIAFQWAGFPGWDRRYRRGGQEPLRFPVELATVAEELLPI